MKNFLLATVAALGIAIASPALADTFLETSVSVIGAKSVVIDSPVVRNVSAGLIQLNGVGGSFMDVFCVDVFDNIQQPYLYNISTWTSGSSFQGMANLTDAQARQIAALAFLGSSSNSGPFLDAVLQLAIWKVEYGGAFATLGLDSGTQNAVNTAILDTNVGGLFDRADLTLHVMSDAPSDPSQAFVFATVAAVPEPSTWAMMILGFCGIVVMGARNKRKNGNGQAFRFA
jgi:PEP-CTERM motif